MGSEGHTAVIVDIDGTLVDTNYHHALAWSRALRRFGVTVELWRLHRLMGMGGDQIVARVAGDEVEREHGDDIRAAEKELYGAMIDEVVPLPDARGLLQALASRMRRVVLASSAKPEEVEHYLDLLDARDLVDAWTTAGDVEATKPSPDVIAAALEKAGGGPAIVIGDTVWDCEAAERAGLPCVGVLTGGVSAGELVGAGAAAVYGSLAELIERLGDPPFQGDGRRVDPA
ncbi:HAD family hydrolase [Miltoncostaea marina]|uniref:HAD family hydrolase n=1 Tax=Miltoncostaea marina TaxID=2843215 RepID=UPI001C3DF050|nr:HAD family hydrolase [Miltoncostaea marina]